MLELFMTPNLIHFKPTVPAKPLDYFATVHKQLPVKIIHTKYTSSNLEFPLFGIPFSHTSILIWANRCTASHPPHIGIKTYQETFRFGGIR